MPKRSSAYISDDLVVSDESGLDSTAALQKKPKFSEALPSSAGLDGVKKIDDNGDTYWELNAKGTRRVTINEFKGRSMVNIREYYEKDGKMLPGKKGISLVMEQFSAFVEALPQIDAILRARGEHIPRPVYAGDEDVSKLQQEEADPEAKHDSKAINGKTQTSKKTKANYEDTSDED